MRPLLAALSCAAAAGWNVSADPLGFQTAAAVSIARDEIAVARATVPHDADRMDLWLFGSPAEGGGQPQPCAVLAWDRVPTLSDYEFRFDLPDGAFLHLVDEAPQEGRTLYAGVWGGAALGGDHALIGDAPRVDVSTYMTSTTGLAAHATWPWSEGNWTYDRLWVPAGAEGLSVAAPAPGALVAAAPGRLPSSPGDAVAGDGNLTFPDFGWWYVAASGELPPATEVGACPAGHAGLWDADCGVEVSTMGVTVFPGSRLAREYTSCWGFFSPYGVCVAEMGAASAGGVAVLSVEPASADVRVVVRLDGGEAVLELEPNADSEWQVRYPPAGGQWWIRVEGGEPDAFFRLRLAVRACDGLCGSHGYCTATEMGGFAVGQCVCDFGWQGAECAERGMGASLYGAQTGLLVASNAFMGPAVAVAARRGLLPEAAVFSGNMLASALYHLCDMDAGCAFGLHYQVLQDADFALSFMSVVAVVVLLAGFGREQAAALRVWMLTALTMCAAQDPTSGWNVAFVGVTCGVLLLGRWAALRAVPRLDWRLVGLGLALWGAAIGGYAGATTENYWVVHSLWHAGAMLAALCFVASSPSPSPSPSSPSPSSPSPSSPSSPSLSRCWGWRRMAVSV